MPTDFSIRPAESGDAGSICRIARDVHRTVVEHRASVTQRTLEFTNDERFYVKAMRTGDRAVFVGAAGADVVGYVLVCEETAPDDLTSIPHALIDEIAVDPRYRHAGIGKALIARAEQWARSHGLTVVQLAVWEFNDHAIRAFQRAGYRTLMRKMEKVLNLPGNS